MNFPTKINPDNTTALDDGSPEDLTFAFASGLLLQRKLRSERLSEIAVVDIEWFVLLELYVATRAKHSLSLSDLYYVSGFPRSTTLRAIDGLVKRGIVFREVDKRDARRKLVHLDAAMNRQLAALLSQMRTDMMSIVRVELSSGV